MPSNSFSEGVRPGGLTTSTQLRILLCYLLSSIGTPISRQQIETALLGEELVNYFLMAESLAQLHSQGLIEGTEQGYTATDAGRTIANTLAHDVPLTVREVAIRGVIRAQQYAAMQAAHQSEIVQTDSGRSIHCTIKDTTGPLFHMQLYMPDALSAEAVQHKFTESGDTVYKLVLAALTNNKALAQQALEALD